MSNLLLLLKVDLFKTFSLNKLKNKSKLKFIGIILLTLFIITSIFFNIGFYTFMAIKYFSKYNLQTYILPLFYVLSSFVIFYNTLYRAKSYLFNSDDIIFSMPIKSSTILASRIITLTLLSYLVTTAIYIPSVVVYGVMLKLNISFYLLNLLTYIFMPLLPTILGSFIGYIIGYFTSKVNNKKIFETVITYSIILIIMYISMNIQNLITKFVHNIESVNKILNSIGFLVKSFMNIIFESSIKDLFIYIGINLLSVILFVSVFNKSFVKIVQKLNNMTTKNKYLGKKYNKKSVLLTLILKEIKMYFSIPIYILNTSFGVILIFFMSIITLFYDKEVIFKLIQLDIQKVPLYLIFLPLIFISISLTSTTSSGISIEGKKIWILKSMPIKVKDIFLSKIILNILIMLPLSIISIILFKVSFEFTLLQTLILILLATISAVTFSMFGIIINLKYPKLEYKSYTEVVKQSISVLISTFIPIIILFILISIYNIFKLPINTYVLIIFTLLLISIMVQYMILKKWGIKRFYKIN